MHNSEFTLKIHRFTYDINVVGEYFKYIGFKKEIKMIPISSNYTVNKSLT